MSFRAVFADVAAPALLDDAAHGEAVTYTPVGGGGGTVQAKVLPAVEQNPIGYESQVTVDHWIIRAQSTDVGRPAPGATFLVGATTYVVDAVIADNGAIVDCLVRAA